MSCSPWGRKNSCATEATDKNGTSMARQGVGAPRRGRPGACPQLQEGIEAGVVGGEEDWALFCGAPPPGAWGACRGPWGCGGPCGPPFPTWERR